MLVSEVDWTDEKWKRAGIIPYIEKNGVKFYAFGVENAVAAICDFGGHREASDGDALDTAIREYREESLAVFGPMSREQLQDCTVIEGYGTLEILVPVSGELFSYTEAFHNLLGNNAKHEVQNIIWLSRTQLLVVINSQGATLWGTKIYHMYNRLRVALHHDRHLL